MSDTMKVVIDDDLFREQLSAMTKQIPYAMATGINNLAKAVQAANIENMKKEFIIRREPFLTRSNKITQFAKKYELTAIVGISPVGSNKTSVFDKFEDGGIKTSSRGAGRVAVPGVDLGVAKDAIIPSRLRPRNLDPTHTFRQIGVGGKAYIFTTIGRGKARQYKLAYILLPEVKIKPQLNYYKTAQETIDKNYVSSMEAAIDKAISTAR